MSSDRADLARRVLLTIRQGQSVPTIEALQLRNWAVEPDDAMLTLAELAARILSQSENGES
jgi:hypothetical protein